MSRGRKAFSEKIDNNWEKAFFNSIGQYINLINKGLAKKFINEPLSKHIKIIGGYAFKNVEYKKTGIPIIRISDFNNEKITLENVVYYEEAKELERYLLKESDIIIALTGGTIGKLGIVQSGLGKLYLNQRVGKFEVLHPDEFEKEYIYWVARGVEGIVKNLAWGAAIPNVSPKQIEELLFPIPTKEIQKNIIKFLNDLKDDLISSDSIYFDSEIEKEIIAVQEKHVTILELSQELTHQLTLIENLNQAILQEAVQGKLVPQDPTDEPASLLLERIKAEKGKKEKTLTPIKPEEIPFEIPENWVWCRLGDLRNFKYTLSYGVLVPGNDAPNGVPLIRVQDLDFADENELPTRKISHSVDSQFAKTKLIGGEILICVVGSIGKVALSSDKWIGSNIARAVCRFMPNQNLSRKFVYYCLLSPYIQNFFKKEQRSINPTLNVNILETTLIPLPPLSEQQRIVAEIEKQLGKTKELKAHIIENQQATEQLLKALLDKILGATANYDDTPPKEKINKTTTEKKIRNNYTFEKLNMKIIEILQSSPQPISAHTVWNRSEYSKDIEAFYAELKRLIDIEKLVVEEKREKESFLKLATNEN